MRKSKNFHFQYGAVVLDLDGVITSTRHLHIRAWIRAFDEYLNVLRRAGIEKADAKLRPFDPNLDYNLYVDGKTREDGIKSFLVSRGIEPRPRIVQAIGAKKNLYYVGLLERDGPHVFKDALKALKIWRRQGIPISVVSSSRNCSLVLRKAKVDEFFQERVDGLVGAEMGLRGKPEPDYFLEAAKRMRINPIRIILVEDAIAGVEAGQRGKFGIVVGMDRSGKNAEALLKHGANYVISSLTELVSPEGIAAA